MIARSVGAERFFIALLRSAGANHTAGAINIWPLWSHANSDIQSAVAASLCRRTPYASRGSKQVFDEAVDVTKPNLVELDRGFAVLSRILMGRNFGDSIAALQALHHHLLLNSGDVFLELERANHF